MKILLRLALLALCGAVGILLALHLAGGNSAPPQAIAAPQVEASPRDVIAAAAVSPPPIAEKVSEPAVVEPSPTKATLPRQARPQRRTAAQVPGLSALGLDENTSPEELRRKLQELTDLADRMKQQGGGLGTGAPMDLDAIRKIADDYGQANRQTQQQVEAVQRELDAMRTAAPPPVIPGLPAPPAAEPPPAQGELVPAPPAVTAEGDGRLTINARGADVRDLLEQLGEQSGLNILASDSAAGSVSVNLQNVGVDEALAAVLKATGLVSRRERNVLYVGTAADFAELEQALGRIRVRVYRPNYLNGKELSNLLTPLLSAGVGKISLTTPAAVGIASDNSTAGGDSFAQSDAIVVQDYEHVLAQIDQVFEELDRRPSQVSIEAVIISVSLNDKNSYGVDFQLLRDQNNVRFGWGSPRQAPLEGGGQNDPVTGAPLGQFAFDTGGLKFAFLDDSLGVFLNALETVGDANVIASPKLLCLNKQKAEILIGSKLGYINTTVTQTFATQNVEFLEVGTQLRLRPYISSDGLIRMEVHPELSTGQVNTVNGVTLPQKELTEVTTDVMCPDGCTVIIGGLMREDLQSVSTQVPLLGSLPLLGPLFRHKDETIARTEVLVLLTPRIVFDADTSAEGAARKTETFDLEAAKFHRMSPLSRAHLSRDYTGRAYAALQQGNRTHARRFAQLAVHYDPLNREAVKALRDIEGNAMPRVHHGWGAQVVVGDGVPGPATIDGDHVPAWMLDELSGSAMPPIPLQPREPGIPGRSIPILRPEVIGDGSP